MRSSTSKLTQLLHIECGERLAEGRKYDRVVVADVGQTLRELLYHYRVVACRKALFVRLNNITYQIHTARSSV